MALRDQGAFTGRSVMVTRAQTQSSELAKKIEELGGEVYEFPTIHIIEPASYAPLDEAIRRIKEFQWLIFTSRNGVDHFFRRVRMIPEVSRNELTKPTVVAVGPKTAEALEAEGIRVDLFPGEYRAEAILSVMEGHVAVGDQVLMPRADIARHVLPEGLRRLGCEVVDVDAYQTVIAEENGDKAARWLASNRIDIITFTSSSTVRHFIQIMDRAELSWRLWMRRVQIACIGPVTADTARGLGLEPDVVASDYTIDGLIAAMIEYFDRDEPVEKRRK